MSTEVVGRTCKGNIYLPFPWIGAETRKAPAAATRCIPAGKDSDGFGVEPRDERISVWIGRARRQAGQSGDEEEGLEQGSQEEG